LLALPLRHGGLGLPNPQESGESEYGNSTLITAKLTGQIYNQKVQIEYNTMDQQHTKTIKTQQCKCHGEILVNLTQGIKDVARM